MASMVDFRFFFPSCPPRTICNTISGMKILSSIPPGEKVSVIRPKYIPEIPDPR
jgi:hypothetical protein